MLGSPFTVEIASPAVVTLYGDGLEAGERGQKTIFMIDTGVPTDIQDINVLVSRESRRLVSLSSKYDIRHLGCVYCLRLSVSRIHLDQSRCVLELWLL